MEDASGLEVLQLRISVNSHYGLEFLASASCHLQLLPDLQVASVEVYVKRLSSV